ncbi:exodeoxyribonuclease V subunit gamma [Nakamurella sp. YIM 132087]|uniref:RecBCD enzyme subunit RecC n=1 Tax=Nakamurella alba TaxID=2665158 RepID=A0A7K1FEY8_9ACTN|nr:exodeoxyribonuclease V subunit gamma [Nakamurella alba]MTD12658.1 exodeoxyribonuclease V subunit gamma [Nakamurella alba]
MALHVHRSERADGLVDGLAGVLAEPLPDVFADDVVAVPARGMERWLMQQLSHRLGAVTGERREAGVCAAIRFPSPGAVFAGLVLGTEDDPWSPERAVWPLLEVIDLAATDPWCAALGRHIGAVDAPDSSAPGAVIPVSEGPDAIEERRSRRYSVALRLARLFSSYAMNRPAVIEDWANGGSGDGLGAALPADLAWQPRLWRLLADRIGAPDPAARLAAPLRIDLPQRVSFFGLTRIPAAHRTLLHTLARDRDVHLWLTHPSPAQWGRDAVRHPLLRSLGRESRELEEVLAAGDATHHPAPAPRRSLLGGLQRGIRDDVAPDGGALPPDGTVQVHACHGPARQVEVLREVLVGLLAADPTLEPRDILVACPDIETFAPLLTAAFGLSEIVGEDGHPGHRLRVKLADRSLQQTNPLFGVAAALLELAGSRVTASQVLDLLARPVVRRRFGLREDDVEVLADWVAESGVRWGLDAASREPFTMETVRENTWRAGLDRILLGVAGGPGSMVAGALALDEVGSSEILLAGRLAEAIDRIDAVLEVFDGEHEVQEWLRLLPDAVESLADVPTGDRWQQAQLRRECADVLDHADGAPIRLRLGDVRSLLADRLAGRPTRANFRTGTLTVCTMVPMRSVPHRVVCLLGLDDGVFPRRAYPDGDDVLARDRRPGERDPRTEDRQLVLDALMAASDAVVITYSGADERTGARRPPAVPLGEILDTVRSLTGLEEDELVVRHPLQPFDPRNVTPGALAPGRPFSHDPSAVEAARASVGRRGAPLAFTGTVLPPADVTDVALDELVRMLTAPARAYLRQRLGVWWPDDEEDPDGGDAVAAELKGLSAWKVGDRMLQARLDGVPMEVCRERELARGELPPGRIGVGRVDEFAAEVEELVEGTVPLRSGPPRTIDVDIPLGDGRVVRGSIPGVYGSCIVRVSYSSEKPKQRLQAWIELLALSAALPGGGWTAVGARKATGRPMKAMLPAVDAADAVALLEELVAIRDLGMQVPLPAPPATAAVYAGARLTGEGVVEATRAAEDAWSKKFGDAVTDGNQRIWRTGQLDELTGTQLELGGLGVAADDPRLVGEHTSFGRLARIVWEPLLTRERRMPL